MIQSNQFLDLLNPALIPETFAKVVRTAIIVGDFVIRNPHMHYHDWPELNGMTGVDRAVQIVASAGVKFAGSFGVISPSFSRAEAKSLLFGRTQPVSNTCLPDGYIRR